MSFFESLKKSALSALKQASKKAVKNALAVRTAAPAPKIKTAVAADATANVIVINKKRGDEFSHPLF